MTNFTYTKKPFRVIDPVVGTIKFEVSTDGRATVDQLTLTSLVATNGTFTSATLTSANATSMVITSLTNTNAVITSLTATYAEPSRILMPTSVRFTDVTAVTVSAPVTSGGHLKVRDAAGTLWYIPVFATIGL